MSAAKSHFRNRYDQLTAAGRGNFEAGRRSEQSDKHQFLGAAARSPLPVPRILVADDDRAIRRLIEIILRNERFDVSTARDGPHAIDLFRCGVFSLVILDWHMPGLSGEHVLDELSKIRPRTKAIVVSGDSPLAVKRAFSKQKVLGHLHKPFKPSELVALVKAALVG